MASQQLYVVNVQGAVVRDGEFLLVTRVRTESHAAGALALPGGTVEGAPAVEGDVLRTTLRRELAEEVGLELRSATFVRSSGFVADDGSPVVNVVFACRAEGEAEVADPAEVADVKWLSPEEVADHPDAAEWTVESVEGAAAALNGSG